MVFAVTIALAGEVPEAGDADSQAALEVTENARAAPVLATATVFDAGDAAPATPSNTSDAGESDNCAGAARFSVTETLWAAAPVGVTVTSPV